MAGGNAITMRVSGALRREGFGVARWGHRPVTNTMYCQSRGTDTCDVDFSYRSESRAQSTRDEALAFLRGQGFICRAWDVTLGSGKKVYSIDVYAPNSAAAAHELQRQAEEAQKAAVEQQAAIIDQQTPRAAGEITGEELLVSAAVEREAGANVAFADPEQDAIDASGLPLVKLTQIHWAMDLNGVRNAYGVNRTGRGARARYDVQAKGGRSVARLLRTMEDAIKAIKADIETAQEA